ncbi:response regulator transcription factor [Marivita sp.]|uniref:winged helix-turn-helix domain-containing protein n=1 Tax=Marivita sp. TaxID=2003365 RepID=UPI0025C293FF|nr:response regulator transcription factor [Marivita sp.]
MSRPVVLAVDDEPAIRDLLRDALEREGLDIRCAGSIAEFEKMAARILVDVYIIDLTLPDGSGFGLVRSLRERGESGIIILSGRGEETDNVVGLELGADDYVTKPFRPRELAARVNAVMRRYRRQSPDVEVEASAETASPAGIDYRFGDYAVSTSARLVWNAEGTEIPLTTAEFELLCALIERRGRVVSRDQLMNAVKGRDWDAYDRAVDGLVSRLRKKLPAPPGRAHYIRTVHGVGYSFSG